MRNVFPRFILKVAMIAAMSMLVACDGDSGTSAKDDESSSSAAEESSSSVVGSPSEGRKPIPYTTECPAGKTCTYAPTEQLNHEMTYGEFLDTRDYQMYKTMTIGEQTWMAQNLNYAYIGAEFEFQGYISDSSSWCYDNAADSCAKYGRYYTWAAAIDSVAMANDVDNPQKCGYGRECMRLKPAALADNPIQGVCPSGWHLPSSAEWNALVTAVGGDGNGADSLGFAVLPTGSRSSLGDFESEGKYAYFWSSTEYSGLSAYGELFSKDVGNVNSRKMYGYSVRCVKD